MTNPPTAAQKREWWTKPSVVLPVVGTVALLVALITPQAASGRFGDPRLSSHLAGSMGARILADAAARLGWRVARNDTSTAPAGSESRTIYAVLAPPLPITPVEAHRYLEAVREGSGLLLALENRTPLSDSLGVTHFVRGGYLATDRESTTGCNGRRDFTPSLWPDGRVHLWGIRWLHDTPADLVVFASLSPEEGSATSLGDAAVGFPYGKGRVAIVGDPDMLRNDVLRRCQWGVDVIAVRMLEWLRAGGESARTTLAFDEYHQGYGASSSVLSVTSAFLVDHPVGRTLFQIVVAGLVLLVAVSPRAIKPQDVERIERRDPLEQVDALAHAYERVHATRTITSRLLRGLRWRVERSGVRAGEDEAFLNAAVTRHPSLKADVERVRNALGTPVPDNELPDIGAALRHIEHTLTTRLT